MSICSENGENSVSVPWPWPPHEYILYTPASLFIKTSNLVQFLFVIKSVRYDIKDDSFPNQSIR